MIFHVRYQVFTEFCAGPVTLLAWEESTQKEKLGQHQVLAHARAAVRRREGRAAVDVAAAADGVEPVCKSTSELGRRGQTSEFSSSVKSKSIRLIFGRLFPSGRDLEVWISFVSISIQIR